MNKGKGNRNIDLVDENGKRLYRALVEITFSDEVNYCQDAHGFIQSMLVDNPIIKDWWVVKREPELKLCPDCGYSGDYCHNHQG